MTSLGVVVVISFTVVDIVMSTEKISSHGEWVNMTITLLSVRDMSRLYLLDCSYRLIY